MKFLKISWNVVLSLLIGFFAIYFLATQLDIKYALQIVKTIKLRYFIIAFVIYYLGFFARGKRWGLLLRNIGLKKGKLIEFTKIYYLNFFINCIIPAKVGDLYRARLIKKRYGIRFLNAFATVAADRLMDIIFVILSFSAYVFFFSPAFVTKKMVLWLVILILIILINIIYIWFAGKNRLLGPLPKIFKEKIYTFSVAFKKTISSKNLHKVILLTLIIWAVEFSVYLLTFLSLNLSYPFHVILIICLLASALSGVPLTPSGLGAVEAGTAGVLILYGLDKNYAIMLVFLVRLINYWSLIIGGALVYISDKK